MLKTLVLMAALVPFAAHAAGSAKHHSKKPRMVAAHKTTKGGTRPASLSSSAPDAKKAPVDVKQQFSDQIEIDEGG